jgi:DNA-binding XRE family transcriptional regulator
MTTAFEQGHCPTVELRHRLRIAREYAGYDSGELADIIGVSRNTISNAESGRVKARTIVINAWAMACGVPKSWLITGKHPTDHPDGGSGLGIIRPEHHAPTRQTTVSKRTRSA